MSLKACCQCEVFEGNWRDGYCHMDPFAVQRVNGQALPCPYGKLLFKHRELEKTLKNIASGDYVKDGGACTCPKEAAKVVEIKLVEGEK